jgi:hypothetical protein
VEQSGGEAVLFLQAARQRPDRRAREAVLACSRRIPSNSSSGGGRLREVVRRVLVRRWDKETAERTRTGRKSTTAEH